MSYHFHFPRNSSDLGNQISIFICLSMYRISYIIQNMFQSIAHIEHFQKVEKNSELFSTEVGDPYGIEPFPSLTSYSHVGQDAEYDIISSPGRKKLASLRWKSKNIRLHCSGP